MVCIASKSKSAKPGFRRWRQSSEPPNRSTCRGPRHNETQRRRPSWLWLQAVSETSFSQQWSSTTSWPSSSTRWQPGSNLRLPKVPHLPHLRMPTSLPSGPARILKFPPCRPAKFVPPIRHPTQPKLTHPRTPTHLPHQHRPAKTIPPWMNRVIIPKSRKKSAAFAWSPCAAPGTRGGPRLLRPAATTFIPSAWPPSSRVDPNPRAQCVAARHRSSCRPALRMATV